MTLNQIFKITGVLSTRKLPSDIAQLLDAEYYSESGDEYTKYGDMDLIHFIRAMKKDQRRRNSYHHDLFENFNKALRELDMEDLNSRKIQSY